MGEIDFDKFNERIVLHSEKLLQHEEKLKKLEDTNLEIMRLAQSIENIANEMKAEREANEKYKDKNDEEIKGIKKEITNINMKPAKNWENAVSNILNLIVGAIAGYIINKFI